MHSVRGDRVLWLSRGLVTICGNCVVELLLVLVLVLCIVVDGSAAVASGTCAVELLLVLCVVTSSL